MKKTLKKSLSVILAVVMICSIFTVAFAAKDDTDYCPSIIIPGLFQSDVRLYNDDGTEMLDSNGNPYSAPFFLDPTVKIVFKALTSVCVPLLSTVFRQKDVGNKFAQALASLLGEVLMGKIKSDSEGNLINNIKAVEYRKSFAECSEEDQKHILSCIPISSYNAIAGEDHLYFFSYVSFGNIDQITAELYDFIQFVKEDSGYDKVNIVPISQGATLFNNLLEYYPQVVNDFNKIVYAIPALDGSSLISDIYKNGFLDDDEALYDYMFPTLMKSTGGDPAVGSLINIIIRFLPKDVLNNVLDTAVDELINGYLKNSTCLWAFVSQDDYEICRDKYLSGDENKCIREQTDRYHVAQVNSKANILKAIDAGVEVFDIVNYNYPLFPIIDSWDDVNADGIIQLSSTSMGAYSMAVDEQLPEGYVQQGNSYGTCSDPEHHNHIDPHNLIDASTGLLPDHTFYYYNGAHESTASDDALIALVVRIMTDDNFKDVYTYPDEFPQFNNARVTKSLRIKMREVENEWDLSKLNADDATELEAAMADAKAMLSETNVDLERCAAVTERFENIYYKAQNKAKPGKSKIETFFMERITKLADKVLEKTGYKGYFDK